MTSIAIIGAGAAGLSTAVSALELGAEVTVIERTYPGSGSTGLSAGVFTTSYADALDVELRVLSAPIFDRLAAEHGLPVIHNGFIRLAHNSAETCLFRRAVNAQRRQGVEGVTLLPPAELKRLVPDLRTDDLQAALWCPRDGYTDGHVLCSVWAELLRERGGRVITGEVIAYERAETHRLFLGSGDSLTADCVVNAAGAWASKIGRLLGHPVPLVNERHQVCFAHLPRTLGYMMPTVMDYTQGTRRVGVYFRQEGENKLLVGLHSNDVGIEEQVNPDDYAHGSDADFIEQVAMELLSRLPNLDLRLQEGYAGIYPYSPDWLPIVGPFAADPSVIACTGGGGVGVNLSPIMGCVAAEWAVFGEARSLAAAQKLLPGRFAQHEVTQV